LHSPAGICCPTAMVPAALGLASDGPVLRRCVIRPVHTVSSDLLVAAVRQRRRRAEVHLACQHSGLVRSAPRQGPRPGGDQGGRHLGVGCRGFFEPLVLGAAAVAFLGRPKSAPGPSEKLLVREERALGDVNAARELLAQATPEEKAVAQKRLNLALRSLSEVEGDLSEAESDLESYPVPDYLKIAYGKMTVMVGVTGASGVGKSSFINVMRRLRPKEAGAAKTGITETTMAPEMFAFPQRQGIFRRTINRVLATGRGMGRSILAKNEPQMEEDIFQVGDRVLTRGLGSNLGDQVTELVAPHGPTSWDVLLGDGRIVKVNRDQLTGVLAETVMWDLPGVGTPNYPQATYLKEMGIRYFDVVVLLTSTRFTEAELMLVNELRRFEVPFFLVRNKIDADVEAEIEAEEEEAGGELDDKRRKEIEEETVQTVKDYFRTEFGLEPVYCISSRRRRASQYDFQKLERDLEEAVKRQRTMDAETDPEADTEEQGRPGHRKRRRP